MFNETSAGKPPSLYKLLIEGRAYYELLAYYLALPLLRTAPRGDGHPVLVLPGLGAGDGSTRPLRRFLRLQGYRPQPWKLGRNLGPIHRCEQRALIRLEDLARAYGCKVSLIGWSLGGVYARELGRLVPEHVRQVITLGSPLQDDLKANHAWRLYEFASRDRLDAIDSAKLAERRVRLSVPLASIYSRSDGIVAWQCSVEPDGPLSENIEVESSHLGLGHNPAVLYAIADRLAQPEGQWRPFDPLGWTRLMYPGRHTMQQKTA